MTGDMFSGGAASDQVELLDGRLFLRGEGGSVGVGSARGGGGAPAFSSAGIRFFLVLNSVPFRAEKEHGGHWLVRRSEPSRSTVFRGGSEGRFG